MCCQHYLTITQGDVISKRIARVSVVNMCPQTNSERLGYNATLCVYFSAHLLPPGVRLGVFVLLTAFKFTATFNFMKQLLSGVSVIFANQRSPTRVPTAVFRYFPRSYCSIAGLPGSVYAITFDWTRKDGHSIRYFYGHTSGGAADFTLDAILLDAPIPKLAGGYLFNFGVRPTLTDIQLL